MDGKLLWIQDAYTVTDRYPYSEPLENGMNYIRNSVKVVIDAYDGSVTFYVADPEDALVRTYQSIFPALFTPMEQMPEFLRSHLRYPEGMFDVQAAAYRSYHMRDARVFYNKEDLWAVPLEVYFGSEQSVVEPYYIIMRLPDEGGAEPRTAVVHQDQFVDQRRDLVAALVVLAQQRLETRQVVGADRADQQ